ncbi:MAG: thioredoxin domain-containing protein [Bradymonadaceae bacterium]|nr:thioredoxin domain-containing protein [Lujinxingiaceae bacterium]
MARFAVALASLGGIMTGWYLSVLHVQAQVGNQVGGGLCNLDGFVNCGSAAHSSYAAIFGVPIASLGIAFYAGAICLTLIPTKAVSDKQAAPEVPWSPAGITTTLFFVSCLYSAFLLVISLSVLKTLCPFCTVMYGLNAIGLAAGAMWYGKLPHKVVAEQLRQFKGLFKSGSALAFVVVFCAALLLAVNLVKADLGIESAELARQAKKQAAHEQVFAESTYRAAHAPGKGPATAPVVLVEFSNFPCPHCGELANTLKQVAEAFGDQVRIEFRHFPLPGQEDGQRAARAGVCANQQGKFWELHDRMFAGAPALAQADILRYASEVGLDADALAQCIDDDLAARIVRADVLAGSTLEIRGTPTFFLNGRRVAGAMAYGELESRIRAELAAR